MNNVTLSIALRLVHIVSGVLWVGAATMLAAYVLPAARSSESGLRFLRELIWVRNLPRYLNVVLGLSILSGLILYGNLMVLTQGAWARSRHGIVLGVGGTSAIIAAAIATFMAAPAIHRALELAEEDASPTETAAGENQAAVNRALRRYTIAMWIVVALLLVAASLMAISRYY